MSWQIAADIREMFVELAAANGDEIFFIRTLNRKDLLTSGLGEALSQLPVGLERASATLRVTTDLESISLRERWLSPAALLATEGFENLLEIGDQRRLSNFTLMPRKKAPTMTRDTCFGVTERIRSDGLVELSLDDKEIEFVTTKLKMSDIQTVAICFLHSNKNPVHEKQLAEKLLASGIQSVCSHQFPGNERDRAQKAVIQAQLVKNNEQLFDEIKKLGFSENSIFVCDQENFKSKQQTDRNLMTLTLLEDRTFVKLRDQAYELKTSGMSGLAFDDGGLVHIGPKSIGSEPGPVSFGKGLDLSMIDLLVCNRGFSFDEMPRLKIIDGARVFRQLGPMAKQLQMSLQATAERFLELAFDLIAIEIKNIATLHDIELSQIELTLEGLLSDVIGHDISKRLNVRKTVLNKNAQWGRAWGLLEPKDVYFNDKLKISEKGSVRHHA